MQYTEKMESALFQSAWSSYDNCDEDYRVLIETLNDKDFFRSFGDGLLFFLQKKRPELTIATAIQYLEECCSMTGVNPKEIASSNTLKNWFKGGPRPKKGEDSRSSIFALAFALQLSPEEAAQLFHEVYLDRAFDYRNEKEIICYFGLKHKLSWLETKRLLTRVCVQDGDANDCTMLTSQLKTDIDLLVDEESLYSYISNHSHNLTKKNIAAKKIVSELINKTKETVELETGLIARRKHAANIYKSKASMYDEFPQIEQYRNIDPQSLNHIYEVVTNGCVRGENGTKTLFKNARLPKEIRNRFPEASTLSKKNPTYEELRKTIILLASYNYWYYVQANNEDTDIEDYIAELDMYLDEAGFSLMYYGNPYDWLFMYCTLQNNPLDTFRGILAEVLDED